MAAFHEILFPLDIALKSAGGPERRTDVVTLGSGREERATRAGGIRAPLRCRLRREDVRGSVKPAPSLTSMPSTATRTLPAIGLTIARGYGS